MASSRKGKVLDGFNPNAVGPQTQEAKVIEIDYKPTAKQREFHSCPADIVLYGGAAGGGKTAALLMEAFTVCLEYPGTEVMLMRRTFPELEKSLVLKSLQMFPREICKYNDQKHKWTIKAGSKESVMWFGFCERDKDVYSYQCFSDDTEILTESGWKLVKDVSVSEKVATMNPQDRKMVYLPCSHTWSYDYNGKMVEVYQKDGVSFKVTPNHNVWISTAKRKDLRPFHAESLPAFFKIPQWTIWKGKRTWKKIKFSASGNRGQNISFTPSQWMKFLGWYLSEGSLDKRRYGISISQKCPDGRARIEVLLKDSGLKFYKDRTAYRFSNKKLCKYLSQFGYSYDKFIPTEVKQYTSPLLEDLLEAIVDGDGHWYRRRKEGVFISSSTRLIDDICEIAIKCGYRPTVAKCQRNPIGSPFGHGDRWRVSLHKRSHDTEGLRWKNLKQVDYNGKVYCITVPPYHTVLIRHRGRVSWSGQSAQWSFLGIDESTHFTSTQIEYLYTRVRSVIPGANPRLRLCTNPGNIGHSWHKKFFQIGFRKSGELWQPPMVDGMTTMPPSRCFISASVYDNKYLMENDPQYVSRLEALPPAQRDMLLYGKWDVFAGQYFSEFDKEKHIIPKFDIPRHWKIYRTVDFGFNDPFVCLFIAGDEQGHYYVFKELYQKGLRDKEQARLIDSVSKWRNGNGSSEDMRIEYTVGDPSMAQRSKDTGVSSQENYSREGVIVLPGSNTRIPGWMQVRNLLSIDPRNGNPWVQFFDNCPNIVREIEEAIIDENNMEDIDKNCSDHAIDAFRYFASTRPSPTEQLKKDDNAIIIDPATKKEWESYRKRCDSIANKNNKAICADFNLE